MRFTLLLALLAAVALARQGVAPLQDQLLEQGARLDAEQKCPEAEALYQKALALSPDSPPLLNNLGNHYLVCGSPTQAQRAFEHLLHLRPSHTNARLQLARISLAHNNAAKALQYLAGINPHDLNDAEISLLRAEALAMSGQRMEAASLLHRIAKTSTDPRLLYTLGLISAHGGFYPEAEDAFGHVLSQTPDDFDVLFNLGLAAAHCSHFEKARTTFELALRLRPADTDTLYELGRVETSLSFYDHAVYVLAQAAKAAPHRPEIQLALARASQMGGFYGDSVLAYDRYLAARPADDMVQRDRALVQGSTHNGQAAALDFLRRYTATHPKDPIGFYDLAQISFRANQPSALKEVSTALQLDPKLEPAYFFRSWILNKSGHYDESLRDATTAVKLNPKDARALDLIGLDKLELNHPLAAEEPIRAALAVSPSEPDFQFHLGRSLLEQGRLKEARPILEEFQKTRQKWTPSPREDAGVIESATLSSQELARRVVNDYKEAVRANPNEPALRLNLSRALLSTGETTEALESFHELLSMEPADAISLDAATALLTAEQYSLACEFLRQAAMGTPTANLDLAAALYLNNEASSALETLDHVPTNERQGDYVWWRAILLNATGRKSDSLSFLESSKITVVSNPRVAPEAASLLASLGRAGQALTLIEQARTSFPDDAPIALTRATLLSSLNRTEDALRAVRELETRWPQWDRPYAAEALLLEKGGHASEAKTRLAIATSLGSDDPTIQCLNSRFQADSASPHCSCLTGIWAMLSPGCL